MDRIRRTRAGRPLVRALLGVVLLVASGAPAQIAVDADARAEARQNAILGQEAYERGDYSDAAYRLSRAHEVMPVPTVGLRYARALVQLGMLREAAAVYEQALAFEPDQAPVDSQLQTAAQAEVRQELGELVPRIPVVTIELEGGDDAARAQVEITIDDQVIPPAAWASVRVNPGFCTVQARRGEQPFSTQEITLREGARQTVVIPLRSDLGGTGSSVTSDGRGSARAQAWRVPAFAALGVGGVGLVVGSVTGVMVLNKKHKLDANGCWTSGDRKVCPSAQDDLRESYNALRPVSTAGFVMGLIGVGVGTTLLLTHRIPREPRVEARVGVGSVEIRGRF